MSEPRRVRTPEINEYVRLPEDLVVAVEKYKERHVGRLRSKKQAYVELLREGLASVEERDRKRAS